MGQKNVRTGRTQLSALFARHIHGEGALFALALIVGLGAGAGALIFRWLIGIVRSISFDWLPQATAGWGPAYLIIAPTIGGLMVGPLIYFFAREAKGHGVPEVMEAVALRGGRIRPLVAVIKSLASALSIGTGGSVGREGPIVQIGSTIGSTVGQWMKLSDDRVRNLVACGAAGGIAATFNAPIAGVFFALEVILGDFSVRSFGTVVISSVTASVIGHAAFGNVPAFQVPEYTLNSIWEFPLYFVLGIAAAIVGVLYTRSIYAAEDLFESWKRVPEWSKAAFGGLLLGCVALSYRMLPGLGYDRIPQVYGVGYETIESGLHGSELMSTMLALVGLKILATSITIGSGGSGGVFAPSLFVGSMLGGSMGLLFAMLFPGIPGPPGAYALVGMGAVFAGSTHASMTAVLIIFEMTGDYKIMLPLMLAVVTSTVLSRLLLRNESIYTLKLRRRGTRLRRGRALDVLEGVRAEEVMSPTETVLPDTSLRGLQESFLKANRNAFPVLDKNSQLVGIVSLSDVRRALESNDGDDDTVVGQIMTPDPVTVFPDENLNAVLQRMAPLDLSRVPVVSRSNDRQLLGVIRRNDVVRAYDLGLSRRGHDEMRIPEGASREGEVEFLELELSRTSRGVGRTLAEINPELPEDSLLVSIRRADGSLIFPRGNTRLMDGDRIVASTRKGGTDDLRRALGGD